MKILCGPAAVKHQRFNNATGKLGRFKPIICVKPEDLPILKHHGFTGNEGVLNKIAICIGSFLLVKGVFGF